MKESTATADSLQKAGFKLMGWDLEWHFNHKTMSVTTPAEAMVAQIDSIFKHNRTKKTDHLILLAHDQVYQKTEDSFQLLKKDDYEFVLATAYPGVEKQNDTSKVKAY